MKKTNGRETKTYLGRFFHNKLGCFDDVHVFVYVDTRHIFSWKLGPGLVLLDKVCPMASAIQSYKQILNFFFLKFAQTGKWTQVFCIYYICEHPTAEQQLLCKQIYKYYL